MRSLDKLLHPPYRLFAIDGGGALLSAFLLGIVLVRWEVVFGIPARVLYVLAAFPVLFAAYDGWCYWRTRHHPAPYLRGIAVANLLYCVLSLGLATVHHSSLTVWGWAYLLGEVGVVIALAMLELRTARRLVSTR
jgi:hypothetical protein